MSAGGHREAGEPIRIPVVDLAEVGAGGGSIAWVDAGGHLRVGPHSAGADPGPACYGRGGTRPTVTDANLVLGYLDAASFNGGRMALHPDRAAAAIDEHLAGPLGLSVVDAARGVHSLANVSMGAAIRIVTLQRGIDPRDHVVVAFGGAGPVHIVNLAEMFGIREVVVPRSPGVKSAEGLLISDLAHETIRTSVLAMDDVDLDALEAAFVGLEDEARRSLAGDDEGARATGRVRIARALDLAFAHKFLSTPVPLAPGTVTARHLVDAEADFRREQRRTFGVASQDRCRIMGLRVHATISVEPPAPARATATGPVSRAQRGTRPVWFDAAGGFVETPVFERSRLGEGHRIEGPAVIEEPDSTTVCPPTHAVDVDAHGNLVIRARSGAAS